MGLTYIDYPQFIKRENYDALINKIVEQLINKKEVVSIYQLGSIKNLGISDLDIVCVFKNNSHCSFNIHKDLSKIEKKILTHSLFGVDLDHLEPSLKFNFFTNFKLLAGENLDIPLNPNCNMEEVLKKQIALEFLLRFFMSLDIQLRHRIIKIHAFLLSAKALAFDLELLNIRGGELYNLIKKVIEWRGVWFTDRPVKKEISDLIRAFHRSLQNLLTEELSKKNLFFPVSSFSIGHNIQVKNSNSFRVNHSGIVLPNQLAFLGKRKFLNIQSRLNKYSYEVPFILSKDGSIISERFKFYTKVRELNKVHYPYFIPLTTGFRIF